MLSVAKSFLILCFAFTAASCGFKLRGAQALPFGSIYLGVAPNSPLAAQLARNIRAGSATRVVPQPQGADAVLEILDEARDREIIAVNAQGRAREYLLRLRLTFRVHDGKGREFIAPTQLVAQRDISFNEEQILAKEAEETLLYRDMQGDLVQQILRRLASVQT
ncbi:MAG TPA: LPS assembly lipoprotein LptE [Burkholderiaceae bacterium]|nr:LPS assembly lipoprotein LptE [Burkholderiaceae bacterium]